MFEGTIESFTITYDSLNERETLSCGDVIKGQISFKVSQQMNICAIMLAIKGEANVVWYNGYDKNRRTYNAREEYFNIKEVLLGEYNNGLGEGKIVLREGTHVYPFSIQLPQGNFPSSFKGLHGSVVYCLEAEIHRPWRMPKEFRSEFNFVNDIDANHPQLLVPQVASSSKELCCLCCTTGPVALGFQLEKKGYVPGETIKIIVEFENATSRTLIPSVALVQTQTFYTRFRTSKKHESRDLALVEGEHLTPHNSTVWESAMLQIPADTPTNLSRCRIMEVEYSLEWLVVLVRRSFEEERIPTHSGCSYP
ncbi:arrestin domain-containing protein 3-like isoform X5 [Conger conger]|uniref:arrestin domain-containing protein 3-like isoform X5 n=1 Tax=Conger conger TaxID=82655 RepID=UPI002A5A08D1|nr:arrestin domain-containing protein 3-like isoform X5 [Conger conger]XP_061116986.1 arrestin domain-containing protein 3-like isoform X5 [Conger conger]